METQSLILCENIKQEPDYEGQTVKTEAIGEEDGDMSCVTKRTWASSPTLSCPKGTQFLYCGKCQLKYEGGCPEHGPLSYTDSAEEGQGEGCSQDSNPQDLAADSKDWHVPVMENVDHLGVCETPDDDDMETLPKTDCRIDQMFSVCETNTGVCVTGTSCGAQSNVEINTPKKVHYVGKPFACDVCGIGFTYCSDLKRHNRIHTGEKPFKCDVCGVGFAQSEHLKTHKRRHTGEKPYKCDVCGAGFTHCGPLKEHKRTHTGEKPYKCDVCGVAFSLCCNLKRHKRIHTGEKPYRCDVCGVGFSRSGTLNAHKRTHTGEKPYTCDVCGIRFTVSSHLKTHKRTHRIEKPNESDNLQVGFSQSDQLKAQNEMCTREMPHKRDISVKKDVRSTMT